MYLDARLHRYKPDDLLYVYYNWYYQDQCLPEITVVDYDLEVPTDLNTRGIQFEYLGIMEVKDIKPFAAMLADTASFETVRFQFNVFQASRMNQS